MRTFTIRHALLFVVLSGFAASGCATYGAEDILRDRYPNPERYRIDDDVYHYVAQVDREIRLDRRQERYVARMLRDRTYRLLDRARPADRRYAYPFPRYQYGDMNRVQRDFWRRADRDIERRLTRAQARRYAYITGNDRYQRYLFGERYARRDGVRRSAPRSDRVERSDGSRGRGETSGRQQGRARSGEVSGRDDD